MRSFFSLSFLELKHILRSKLSWLLAALTVISIFLPPLSLLFGQFILLYQLTRDKRANVFGLFSTLPHTASKLYFARILAGFVLLLALWPFMLFFLAFVPELEVAPWLFTPGCIWLLTFKYFILCLIEVSLVSFFSTITRQLLWLLLLVIACWIKILELASNLSLLPSFSKLFAFGQGFMLPSAPSLAIGYFPDQNLILYIGIFHAGLALFLVVITAISRALARGEPVLRSRIIIGLSLISLTFLWIGSQSALHKLEHREQSFHKLLESRNTTKSADKQASAIFTPETYNLEVKLKTTDHFFSGTATIRGRLNSLEFNRILFTLRDCFTVTEVRDTASKKPLNWTQNGSFLAVCLPETYQENDTLTLSVSYSGEVWEWFPDRMAKPNGPVNFIAPSFSMLRSGHAWYPIAGANDLYTVNNYTNPITDTKITTLQANRTVHPPLPFTLTVDIDTDNLVASNLEQTAAETLLGEYRQRYHFYSEKGHDLFLLAGPYQHNSLRIADEKISVYNFHLHKTEISRVIHSLSKLYTIYNDMLAEKTAAPESEKTKYTIVEIPPFLLYSEDGQPRKNLTLTDTIALSENYFKTKNHTLDFLNEIRNYKRDIAVLQSLWQEDLTDNMDMQQWGSGNLNNSLGYYLYIVGLEKSRLPECYSEARQNIMTGNSVLLDGFCLPYLSLNPVTKEVFLVLDTIRTELGEQTLKKVIHPLYSRYKTKGSLQAAYFSQTVTNVLRTSALSPEKQAEIQKQLLIIEELTEQPTTIKASPSRTLFSFDLEEYLP